MKALGPTLDEAQATATRVAERHRSRLNADDHHQLALAFHRAETLAEFALLEALEQVPLKYRAELEEQIEDERRHVDVFARWLGTPPEVRRPKSRQRPEIVWYSVLLVNEIAGYCQFHMLAGLLDDPAARTDVEAIARDERVHIARLVGWLAEFSGTSTWGDAQQVIDAFQRRLDRRMQQFLPREELSDVRGEMAEVIDSMIGAALSSCHEAAL